MTDDIFIDEAGFLEEQWSKGLSREDTLERQIRTIVYYYSKGLWDEFEYGIKALYPLLPGKVREQFLPLEHDTSSIGIQKHYDYFLTIQKKIEDDTNMIWRKRFVKTYE